MSLEITTKQRVADISFTVSLGKFTKKQYAYGQLVWHIQDDPKILRKCVQNYEIESISASGDELEKIRARFDNLPNPKGNFAVWSGDMAQFILANL